jgi:hypothetical protein
MKYNACAESRLCAAGVHLSMRLWEGEEPGEPKPVSARDYETARASCSTARPSYNSKAKRYCWRKAIRGLFPKVRRTLTKFWKPLPQSKPPVRPQKYTTATPDQLLPPEARILHSAHWLCGEATEECPDRAIAWRTGSRRPCRCSQRSGEVIPLWDTTDRRFNDLIDIFKFLETYSRRNLK